MNIPRLYQNFILVILSQCKIKLDLIQTRWDKTGIIVEVRDHGQYLVRLHGSGRCTLRNSRFIRQCTPFCNDSRYTEWPTTNIPTEKADEFANSHPVPLLSNLYDLKSGKEEDNTSPIEQIETETLPDTSTPGVPQDSNQLNDTQSKLAPPPSSTPSSPTLTSLRRRHKKDTPGIVTSF